MSDVQVDLVNASLRFRIYHNPTPSLKETITSRFTRRKQLFNTITEFYALKDITLSIKRGERVGIVGLNGAGKSTLLKVIAGVYPLHQGSLRVQGRVIPLIELGTGFNMEMSGRDNIYLNGAMLGFSPTEMQAYEQKIIDFAEIHEFIDLPLKYFSSGMNMRLAFSIATLIQPEILIVDEIFAGGDAKFVGKATARMNNLINSTPIVIFVSHRAELVKQICNRVVVLHKGQLMNDGDPETMVQYYMDHIVAE